MSLIKLVLTGSVAVLLVTACALSPKKQISTEVLLPASPDTVWAVLIDTERYSEWNPFIIESEGEVLEGARITNTMRPEPGREMVFRPKILVARPNQELRWIGRAFMPGIFDGEHYFLLEPQDGQTRMVHGEKFSGVALWFMDVAPFEANFMEMNEALKARLEALNNTGSESYNRLTTGLGTNADSSLKSRLLPDTAQLLQRLQYGSFLCAPNWGIYLSDDRSNCFFSRAGLSADADAGCCCQNGGDGWKAR